MALLPRWLVRTLLFEPGHRTLTRSGYRSGTCGRRIVIPSIKYAGLRRLNVIPVYRTDAGVAGDISIEKIIRHET
ncbi:hypothetical protein N7462_000050 [Penicillium macrosclerotiorum]|uniref:uncharacterized protein n=1 Tax=Penicillium macrosclerotiorum TaxID=303699 RepID=UPI0025476E39|nr:uncharacterized protein N7462_000050 [Penicillium macrosclerotiorum]KAJ5698045.1 hypothetical protein N7462_000050 [Penicillium macrosclerotiorum]